MYLFGASGHAKVILDILELNGSVVKGFFDDDPSRKNLKGIPVIGHTDDHDVSQVPCLISIGNNSIRKRVVERVNAQIYGICIHPDTVISSTVKVSEGTVVMAGAIINSDTLVGRHSIINTSASVDHDCYIGDYCHIAPNCTLCGGISVGEGTLVGAGTVIIPNINIGKWAIVAAGSVVTKDVPDYTMVAGNPARFIKDLYHG